ncbi:MAG: hypothetical protein KBT47_00200, partial [Armatimonadetes bacterium]|nr:hypothetical protein [Candidatus Hippobium faecium]
MRKICFLLFLIFLSVTVSAKTYEVKNRDIKIAVTLYDKNPIISSIQDLKTGQEFIGDTDRNSTLWTVTLKHKGRFEEMPGYVITPKNAEKTEIIKKGNSLILNFYNVRDDEMEEGFFVTCSVSLDKNNSYWDMTVNPGKIYGIWEVAYPFISNLDTQNGDCFMIPAQGDVFLREFDSEKGFPDPARQDLVSYTKNYTYGYPSRMQYSSLTKGRSTLYMCPEDNTVMFKTISFTTQKPNTMNVNPTYFPADMGIGGKKFTLPKPYNIAVIQGDWFDAAKKYRKWGIDSHYAPFAKGKIEDRKDLPDWWKNLCWCVRASIDHSYYRTENVIDTIKDFKVPPLVHLYSWSIYRHDTHYP